LIAQAGTGSDQIGRFDIVIDDDTNRVVDYKWQFIPIDNNLAEPDKDLEKFIASFQSAVDNKYNAIVTKLATKLTHPKREIETSLGNLFADAMAEVAECEVMMVGSGSIRSKELGPIVTLKDLKACFPYDDSLTRFTVNGKQLKTMFERVMRIENRDGEGENYQINRRVRAVYDDGAKKLILLTIDGKEVEDDKEYTVCLQGYHVSNSTDYLGITNEELVASGKTKVITTSAYEVLEEYLKGHQNINVSVGGRLEYR